MSDDARAGPLPHPERHREMLERYGFGLFALPPYRDAAVGDWRIVRHGRAAVAGYVSGVTLEPRRHVLYHGRKPWMSTSLMEQESHGFHVDRARGVVVVAGLGMAMYAHAVSLRPEVDRVVVVERAPEVIAIVREAVAPARWPTRDKVTILEADALALDLAERVLAATDGRAPDYLYADIWQRSDAPEAPSETARMAQALRARAAGWWGQEQAFGLWCRDGDREPDAASLRAYADHVGVPLPITEGYVAFCRDVAARLPRRRWSGRLWRLLKRAGGA